MWELSLEYIRNKANYIRSVFHFLWYHQDKYPAELIEKINKLRAKQGIVLWHNYQWCKIIPKDNPQFHLQAQKDFEKRSWKEWNKILNKV